jgi:peroxiredoxin
MNEKLRMVSIAAGSGIIVFLLASTVRTLGSDSLGVEGREQVTVGAPAPDFLLADESGKQYRLSQLRGHKVLLNFLCGCADCAKLARAWENVHETAPEVNVLGISTVASTYLRAFRDETRVTFPILFDPGFAVAERYRSLHCPRSWVIDESGTVVYASDRTKPAATLPSLMRVLVPPAPAEASTARTAAEVNHHG